MFLVSCKENLILRQVGLNHSMCLKSPEALENTCPFPFEFLYAICSNHSRLLALLHFSISRDRLSRPLFFGCKWFHLAGWV